MMTVERWLTTNLDQPILRSSNVRVIRWDWRAKRLYVGFKDGSLYYYNVSEQVAREQFDAVSHGKHVWKMRRAGVVGIKVRDAGRGAPRRKLRRR
jgi:hypothetical protein